MAQKINFDSNKTAISVTYTSLLSTITINVTREVIVSAGAFQSPQLVSLLSSACRTTSWSTVQLMLSGIGPSAQLQKFKWVPLVISPRFCFDQTCSIPVLVDLPGVGQNLQDHVFFSPGYEINPNIYQVCFSLDLTTIRLTFWSALVWTWISDSQPVAQCWRSDLHEHRQPYKPRTQIQFVPNCITLK